MTVRFKMKPNRSREVTQELSIIDAGARLEVVLEFWEQVTLHTLLVVSQELAGAVLRANGPGWERSVSVEACLSCLQTDGVSVELEEGLHGLLHVLPAL